jgi:hypothetical protein
LIPKKPKTSSLKLDLITNLNFLKLKNLPTLPQNFYPIVLSKSKNFTKMAINHNPYKLIVEK